MRSRISRGHRRGEVLWQPGFGVADLVELTASDHWMIEHGVHPGGQCLGLWVPRNRPVADHSSYRRPCDRKGVVRRPGRKPSPWTLRHWCGVAVALRLAGREAGPGQGPSALPVAGADCDASAVTVGPDLAPAPATTTSSGHLWLIVGIVIAVQVGGVLVAIAVNDDDRSSYDANQIGWIRDSCEQWSGDYSGDGPPDSWCASMADWMNGRLGQGSSDGMMTGQMMWQDPDSMRATCEQWVTTTPNADESDTQSWCSQMVDWMSQQHGDWDTWMRDGPMMGHH